MRIFGSRLSAGLTGSDGRLDSVYWLEGDTLAVLYPVHTVVSPKRPTESSWTVYATNVTIPLAGAPEMYVLGNPATLPNPLVIEIDAGHPVIGFRVVFSVEWDAPAAYLDDLRDGALRASTFLYDGTDDSQTQQDALNNGESTWETFGRRYGDPSTSIQLWTLQSPVERGAIVRLSG